MLGFFRPLAPSRGNEADSLPAQSLSPSIKRQQQSRDTEIHPDPVRIIALPHGQQLASHNGRRVLPPVRVQARDVLGRDEDQHPRPRKRLQHLGVRPVPHDLVLAQPAAVQRHVRREQALERHDLERRPRDLQRAARDAVDPAGEPEARQGLHDAEDGVQRRGGRVRARDAEGDIVAQQLDDRDADVQEQGDSWELVDARVGVRGGLLPDVAGPVDPDVGHPGELEMDLVQVTGGVHPAVDVVHCHVLIGIHDESRISLILKHGERGEGEQSSGRLWGQTLITSDTL